MVPTLTAGQPERVTKAVTRRHHLDGLEPFLDYARMAAETAAFVSISNGLHNRYALQTALYHRLRDDRVNPAITQGCIRQGAAAAKNVDDPEGSPTFKNPVLILNNQKWRLNPVGDAYIAHANIGTRQHPRVVAIPVTKGVGDMVSEHDRGELWIGGTHFTITYSKMAPVPRRTERGRVEVAELVSGIDYVGGEPENVLAVDMNAWGCMAGDDDVVAKFDLSGRVNAVVRAKTDNEPRDEHRRRANVWRYERRKRRKVSNGVVEVKRARRVVVLGGRRKIHKDGLDIRRLKKSRERELKRLTTERRAATRKAVDDAEKAAVKIEFGRRRTAIKADHDRMMAKAKCMRRRRRRALEPSPKADNAAKRRMVTKARRSLEHAMHAASIIIVVMALRGNAVLVLEDLTGMAAGWTRAGRFGRLLRRKLHGAAMLKFQGFIRHKAAWAGVETLMMNPRHTSARCCVCRHLLRGDYLYRTCPDCHLRVDRDVNAVRNMRRTTAAARYGGMVPPSRDEAQRAPDVILCPGVIVRGGRSLRVDREVDAGGRVPEVTGQGMSR